MPLQHSPDPYNPNAEATLPMRFEDEANDNMATQPPSAARRAIEAQYVEANEFLNVRMSTFWPETPKLWFRQLEGEFQLHRIRSDDIKYSAVLRHLDQRTMKMIADVIEPPPEKDKYNTLKEALIARFTDSEERQLRKLLTGLELGTKKPSELLREMRILAGNGVADKLLQTLWMQRLPRRVQELLSVIDQGMELGKLANLADKAMEKSDPEYAVAEVERSSPMASLQNAIDAVAVLVKQASEISIQTQRTVSSMVEAVSKFQERSRPWQRRPWRRDRSRSGSRPRSGLCYFHRRFGKNSWKCEKPCAWRDGPTTQQQEN